LAASICNQIISIRHTTMLTTIAGSLKSSFSRMARRGSRTRGAMREVMQKTTRSLIKRNIHPISSTVIDFKIGKSSPRSPMPKSSSRLKSGDKWLTQRRRIGRNLAQRNSIRTISSLNKNQSENSTSPSAQQMNSLSQLAYGEVSQKRNLRLETTFSSQSAGYKSQKDDSKISNPESRLSQRRINRNSKPLNMESGRWSFKQGPISLRESLEGEPLDNHPSLIASVARRHNERSVDASPTIRSNDMNASDDERKHSSDHGLQSLPSLKEDDIATLEKLVKKPLAESNFRRISLDQDDLSRRLSDTILSSNFSFSMGDTTTVLKNDNRLFILNASESMTPMQLPDEMLVMNLTLTFP